MSDRCHAHKRRCCTACVETATGLTPERLDELDRIYDNPNWQGWGITDVVKSLTAALRDERAARQQDVRRLTDQCDHWTARAEQAEAERDDLARRVGEHAKEASKWRVWREQDARHISDRDKALAEMARQRDEARRNGGAR